jgi:hypothetical protein
MKSDTRDNIIFVLFLIVILILAAIYFTVPERKTFLENQMKWWSELWSLVKK